MKIEIEVTENEIKDAIERKARQAIAEYTNRDWLNAPVIKQKIKDYWTETVDKIVKSEIENSDLIRQKVIGIIERKIHGQVTALMKARL